MFSFQIRRIVNAFAVFLASVWVSVWACIFISQGIELLSNQSDGLLRAKDIRIERRYISLIFFFKRPLQVKAPWPKSTGAVNMYFTSH